MYHPSLEEVKKLSQQGNLVPLWREVVADLETPVSCFLKIQRGGPSFLLESVEGGAHQARYSFIGTEPARLLRLEEGDGDPLPAVQAMLGQYRVAGGAGLPRFAGGAVGYLSYETAARFEKLPVPAADPLGLPLACFMLAETLLIFDHVTHRLKILSYVHLDGPDIAAAYAAAARQIDDLAERLSQPLPTGEAAPPATPLGHQLSSNVTRADFEAGVQAIKALITSGEAIQVVLSQRLACPTQAPPFAIYRALRSINPSPYMFYLDFTDFQLIGASPETLVRVEDGVVMTRPLAGTRPRGRTEAEDARLEAELRHDEKERAEHVMLVDLGRNDVGRVAVPGTVTVSDLLEVERYSHVMHLVSQVQGRLRPELSCFDALRACFPAGTVSGAPKIRAMQVIAGLEPARRGPYGGAAGYFSFGGNMDLAIAIRTIVRQGDVAYAQAGCGVVADSVPAREYEETLHKARAMLGAIRQAEGEEEPGVTLNR